MNYTKPSENTKNLMFFVGGARGSGKSLILSEIAEENNFEVINTGKFFYKGLPIPEAKELMIETLLEYSSPIIVDTHYAGYVESPFTGKFQRGLSRKDLDRLNSKINMELILLDLDYQILHKRILSEKDKPRDGNVEHIKEDLKLNRQYFKEYCDQLGKTGQIILNLDRDFTKKQLIKTILEKNAN